MVNFFKAAAAGVLAFAGAVQAAAIGNQFAGGYQGSIEVKSTNPLQIRYSTSQPDPKNWIGIYSAADGGPDDQKHAKDSLKWAYAPDLEGTVTIPTDGLPAGDYKAYFLARDKYTWQAAPVQFSLEKDWSGAIKVTSGYPIRVQYSTSHPNSNNWIGIYFASGGGPDAGNATTGDYFSIRWVYAGDSQGVVEIPADGVGDGVYKAFFLADNGYESLASPQIFTQGNAVFPGAIAVDYGRTSFTFRYTTQRPDDQNWIGIYPYGQGPDSQSQVGASPAWDWAKSSRDALTVPADKLASGRYQAFFLAKNGYKWLASPITISK